MNFCYLGGKITSDIDFKFVLTGKNCSIAKFTLELFDNTILNIKVYNEIADFSYRRLKLR